MANQNETKVKLSIMKMRGCSWILIDILSLNDQVQGIVRPVEYYSRIIGEYKKSLVRELKTEEITAATIDLEVLINNIKSGVEPEWKNKHNNNDNRGDKVV